MKLFILFSAIKRRRKNGRKRKNKKKKMASTQSYSESIKCSNEICAILFGPWINDNWFLEKSEQEKMEKSTLHLNLLLSRFEFNL